MTRLEHLPPVAVEYVPAKQAAHVVDDVAPATRQTVETLNKSAEIFTIFTHYSLFRPWTSILQKNTIQIYALANQNRLCQL